MSRVVGKKLRDTREENNLTIDQVVQVTHIRAHYLEAMETGNFDTLPSMLQVKGFLRSYASFLGLNSEPLLEALDLDPWSALETITENPETEETESPDEVVDSATNFINIGKSLQAQRQMLGLSLEDIENHTHIKLRYLKDLEAGKINALPSPVQGRGMLKNYASFLGLNPDDLLLQFANGLQARLIENQSSKGGKTAPPGPRPARKERRGFPHDILLGAFLGIALVVFIIWGALQVGEIRSHEEIEPTAPSIADVLLPSATPSPIPTATITRASLLDEANGEPDALAAQPNAEATQEIIYVSEDFNRPVQVQIITRQRSWMRITVDEKVEFDGRVIPGSAYAFAGDDYVEITTGNGAGLQVIYNDSDLGTLGAYGQVINFVITLNGIQTPTPTLTLTSTETPELTPTPTPNP